MDILEVLGHYFMKVINIQKIWAGLRSSSGFALPQYDPFKELSAKARTEIFITGNGYSLYRKSLANNPLSTQAKLIDKENLREVCALLQRGEEVVASIDIDSCFVRQVILPQNAAAKIEEIIDLDLVRVTPFSLESVFSGWVNRGLLDDSDVLNIEHIVIRKDVVNPALKAVRDSGAWPIGLFVRDAEGVGLPLALSPDGSLFQSGLMKRWIHVSAVAVLTLCLSATAFAGSILWRQSQLSTMIEQNIQSHEIDVANIRSQLASIKDSSAAISVLQLRKFGTASRIQIIEELSRILPDSAYLDGISVLGNQVNLDGGASSPEQLIAALESSELFHNVTFGSPVFRTPGEDMSRFSIRLDIDGAQK